MTLGRMGRWNEAIEYYNRALELRPDYAEVHRNRAYGWLYIGDFERGWREHEWRLKCRRHAGFQVDRPLWQGEELDGRPIVLHAEQGLGDTLQFIRYAALVKQRGGVVFVAGAHADCSASSRGAPASTWHSMEARSCPIVRCMPR